MEEYASESIDLVPARMINEYVYCPRLAFIEWVEGDFRDNHFTADGRHAHRRVDVERGGNAGALPRPSEHAQEPRQQQEPGQQQEPDHEQEPQGQGADDTRIHARSLMMSAPVAGIIARMDILEAEGRRATPVDYKRGRPPRVEGQVYDPERAQLCAQAIVLEENGFECPHGVIYYTRARRRVEVPFDDALRARTLAAAGELRVLARSGELPAPLQDSPKCFGCSLVGVCLPDEVAFLRQSDGPQPRRLFPARDDALPLHIQAQGARLGKKGSCLVVRPRDAPQTEVRLKDVSQVSLYGNVQVSTQTIRVLCERGIPLCYFSWGGWFYAMVQGLPHGNVRLRRAQFAASADGQRSLRIARSIVTQKIKNQRTLLRRNNPDVPAQALQLLRELARKAAAADSPATLLGLEGSAARTYFASFTGMLRPPGDGGLEFQVTSRNRRPPRDPVNALLSFAYSLLVKELTILLASVGFDPHCGFYHRDRHGRPALALDVMEPFRPIIADSVVLGAINNGVVRHDSFQRRLGSVNLDKAARRRFIQAYERRMNEEVTHPTFGYRISYRRVLEVQARLLGRMLVGEVDDYPVFVTR